MIIYRDYERTEHDDFLLNVEQILTKQTEAVPIYAEWGEILGWNIQPIYE